MKEIAAIVVGYVFVMWWLVQKLEANREKLLPNLPEWLRRVLLILVCMLPFAGQLLSYPTGGPYALIILIPAIGALSALVNAMAEGLTEFLMIQTLIGIFAWWGNWLSAKLYALYVNNDALSQSVSVLLLFIELTILMIFTVILAIRKHRKG